MDNLFPTLNAKTFFILTLQLTITWLSARLALLRLRQIYDSGKVNWITGSKRADGKIDLIVDGRALKVPWYSFLIANGVMFAILFFWGQYQSLPIALGIFALWSVAVGTQLAIILVSVDENLGAHILSLTIMGTAAAGLIGSFSKLDFTALSQWLFVALLGLIVFNVVRLFIAIPRSATRIAAAVGVVIFLGYLVYDFSRLSALQAKGVNNWPAAMDIAIQVYLDIINLFLQLLDALSNNK